MTIQNVPIFPLKGALLLPSGNLPLNIFEDRYLSMVDFALASDKLIGMIQPKVQDDRTLYNVGCIGKITDIKTTEQNTYLINLLGLYKFDVIEEVDNSQKFRILKVKFDQNKSNFFNNEIKLNKKILINKLRLFFKKNDLFFNLDILDELEISSLIINMAMLCPFHISEKQMLLESKNLEKLYENLTSLLDISLIGNLNNETMN